MITKKLLLTKPIFHCRTEKSSEHLLRILQRKNCNWRDGSDLTSLKSYWQGIGGKLCYFIEPSPYNINKFHVLYGEIDDMNIEFENDVIDFIIYRIKHIAEEILNK